MFKNFIELVVEQSPRVHAMHSSHNPIRCAGLHNPLHYQQCSIQQNSYLLVSEQYEYPSVSHGYVSDKIVAF